MFYIVTNCNAMSSLIFEKIGSMYRMFYLLFFFNSTMVISDTIKLIKYVIK